MNDQVSKRPIVALITVISVSVVIVSVVNARLGRDKQTKAEEALVQDHKATEATMKAIGEQAEAESKARAEKADRAYRMTPEAVELERLRQDDLRAIADHR